jgi:hypothetical protein
MKRFSIVFPILLSTAACAIEGSEPIVSSYNGDSVNIIQPMFASMTDQQLLDKANSICQRGSKKFAERVLRRALPDYEGTEFLFLCLDKA